MLSNVPFLGCSHYYLLCFSPEVSVIVFDVELCSWGGEDAPFNIWSCFSGVADNKFGDFAIVLALFENSLIVLITPLFTAVDLPLRVIWEFSIACFLLKFLKAFCFFYLDCWTSLANSLPACLSKVAFTSGIMLDSFFRRNEPSVICLLVRAFREVHLFAPLIGCIITIFVSWNVSTFGINC